MSVFNPRPRRALSAGAVRLLRRIVTYTDEHGHPPTAVDVFQRPETGREYQALHVLADRWLVVVQGGAIHPRRKGREILRQPYYRDLV